MKTDKTRTVWKVSRHIPWSHTDAAGVPPGPAEVCWLRLSCVELQASFSELAECGHHEVEPRRGAVSEYDELVTLSEPY